MIDCFAFLRKTFFATASLVLIASIHPAACAADGSEPAQFPAFETLPAQLPDEALLKRLAAKSVKGRFEERRTVPGFPKPMVTTGVFEMKGDRLRWEAEKPFPSVMTASPEGVVMEAAGEKQVLSAADVPAAGRISVLLSSVLSGNFSALNEMFDVRAQSLPDGGVRMAARPKSRELGQALEEVRAEGRDFVERIEVISKQGRTEILFSDVAKGR